MAYDFTDIFQRLETIDTTTKDNWVGDDGLYNKIILLKPLCENRLKSVYAGLLSQTDISSLQTHLSQMESYINTYKAGHTNYRGNVENALNSVIQIISKIPFVGKGETSTTFKKIIDDFNQRYNDALEQITEQKDALTQEVNSLKKQLLELSAEVTKKSTEVVGLTTEFQKQFSDAQEKRSESFATAQESRAGEFDSATKGFESTFELLEQERTKNFMSLKQEVETSAKQTLADTENIKTKVEEIYGAIGKASMAGEQMKYADNAETFAHCLQGASVVLMLVAFGALIYFFSEFMTNPETLTWKALLLRLSIGGSLLLPAFYLANEGKKQREKENKYRELGIKMTALTPYFLEIGDNGAQNISEKDRVKLELGQKLLSPTENKPDKNVVLPPDILELVKTITEAVSKKE